MIDVLCAMLLLIGLNFIFATRSKFRIFLWLAIILVLGILLSMVPVPRKKAAGDAPVNGASPAGNARLIQLRRDQPKTPTALRMTTAIRQITEATAQGTVTYFTDCLVFRWKN